jgi:menaquinone-dependent protoporphyrinogen IX oxidase
MKTVVIYRSKSGFVRKYAEWIAEELSADLIEHSKADASTFERYDAVVYGGGLYVGGINGVKIITSNMNRLEGKRVTVFASGATPPRTEALEEIVKKNFTPEQLKKLKFFYLRGGFDYGKLGFTDKALMLLMKSKLLLRKYVTKNMQPDEKGLLSAYDKPVDFTKRKNIKELVDYIRDGSAGL